MQQLTERSEHSEQNALIIRFFVFLSDLTDFARFLVPGDMRVVKSMVN
jgi:hypothetical protein